MMTLIILAFANFMMIINQNVIHSDKPYVEPIIGNQYVDAIISVYMLSQGDF